MSVRDVDSPAPSRSERPRGSRLADLWLAGRPYLILLVLSGAGLALRQLIGPVIRWNLSVDDENQMRVAAALESGDWLGTWGSQPIPHVTLSKGPGYPLFVALLEPLGVSPRIGAYLIYLVGAVFLVLGLRTLIGWGWGLAVYGLLAFNPQVMGVAFSRPYRDQLVTSLALAAFGAAVYLGRVLRDDTGWRWPRWVGAVLATVVLAVSIGWLGITRNDAVWVAVSSALVIATALLPIARRLWWRGWLRAAVVVAAVLISVVGVSTAVASINEQHYGVRLTDDYNQGEFKEAVRSWEAVIAPGGDPFMLVTRPARQAVYAVSPAAREVQSALEDPKNPWRGWPCGWRPKEAPPCDEFGPFFGWAIRDAAYQAGYRTPSRFQEYFGRLNAEIDAACGSSTVRCGTKGISADLPPIDAWSARTIVSNSANLARGAMSFQDVDEGAQAPVPQDASIVALWERTLPDVRGVTQMLTAGMDPDVIAQKGAVDALRQIYSVLAVLAILATLVGLGSGLLFRHRVGWVALSAFAGWVANLVIVATVFAATNRQLDAGIPSYTVPSQAFLIIGLTLSSWVTLVVGGRWLLRSRWMSERASASPS